MFNVYSSIIPILQYIAPPNEGDEWQMRHATLLVENKAKHMAMVQLLRS